MRRLPSRNQLAVLLFTMHFGACAGGGERDSETAEISAYDFQAVYTDDNRGTYAAVEVALDDSLAIGLRLEFSAALRR